MREFIVLFLYNICHMLIHSEKVTLLYVTFLSKSIALIAFETLFFSSSSSVLGMQLSLGIHLIQLYLIHSFILYSLFCWIKERMGDKNMMMLYILCSLHNFSLPNSVPSLGLPSSLFRSFILFLFFSHDFSISIHLFIFSFHLSCFLHVYICYLFIFCIFY